MDRFDIDRFELQWPELSTSEKADIIKGAPDLAPEKAIRPIAAGLVSSSKILKNFAKRSLDLLRDRLVPQTSARGLSVCTGLYALLDASMEDSDRAYVLAALLRFGQEGASFAFKAVCRDLVSLEFTQAVMPDVSEGDRLRFVRCYLGASPWIRLKLAPAFKQILRSLQDRDAVVCFYAELFDRREDPDPFLLNISSRLRNSGRILSDEIKSPHPEQRILGIKALAMIQDQIPYDILAGLLADESDEGVRVALYNLIEASPVRYYPRLCYPILQFFYQRSESEALHAFRAMAVTGKFPLFRLLNIVRTKYPALMPGILEEAASFSRFSFLIIQDIALNPGEYQGENIDVNLAAVLGMIKKRPERILKLLSASQDSGEATEFVRKVGALLGQERVGIDTAFDEQIRQVTIRCGQVTREDRSATFQKLSALMQEGHAGAWVLFENEVLMDEDLCGSIVESVPMLFKDTLVKGTDLTGAYWTGTVFRQSVLYEVDMPGAHFEKACFDHTVFIDVNAEDASFVNCSFEGASFHRVDFSRADLTGANFHGARISQSKFAGSDLSGACFAQADICDLSFEEAILNSADFSGVKALFCHFPASSLVRIRSGDVDLNARKYQISGTMLPPLDRTAVARINREIFCEFIHYGEQQFYKQNRLSLLTAYDVFRADQVDLFRLVPILLHENIQVPGYPGIDPLTPYGIWNFVPDPDTQALTDRYLAGRTVRARFDRPPAIQAVFCMGSVGSIAQTAESDIDYWVCIDENRLDAEGPSRLQKKLEIIERVAAEKFGTQITFFIVDIYKAKINDFGEFSTESSGSAQSRLLKEEFYRTMIHVVGKLPLWAVLPSSVSLNYYDYIGNAVVHSVRDSKYMDMGDINAISTAEYFGGCLWQMFKGLKSPFKSVLKMALLEKYINEYGREKLLCNIYKDEWMNSGAHLKLAQNDPYYILVDRLINYFKVLKTTDSVDLLLTSFFMKLGIESEAQLRNTPFGYRKILLEKCIRQWGFDKLSIFKAGRYKHWDYREVVLLSSNIKSYMINTYKAVSQRLARQGDDRARISPKDRTVLGRKVFIEFAKQPGRIEKNFIIAENDQFYQRLHLRYLDRGIRKGGWELFRKGTREQGFKEESLIRGRSIEKIGLWMIRNRLYSREDMIQLVPNSTYVRANDIERLYTAMDDFFSVPLAQVVNFDFLLKQSKVIGLFVSINLYAREPQKSVYDYTVAYLNSWGEIFYEQVDCSSSPLPIGRLKDEAFERAGLTKPPRNLVFYSPKDGKIPIKTMPVDWDMPELY